jgi:hypothetical protein
MSIPRTMEEDIVSHFDELVGNLAAKGIEAELKDRVAKENGTLLRVSAHWSENSNRFYGSGLSYTADDMGGLAQTIWHWNDGGWFIENYLILTPDEEKIVAGLQKKARRR